MEHIKPKAEACIPISLPASEWKEMMLSSFERRARVVLLRALYANPTFRFDARDQSMAIAVGNKGVSSILGQIYKPYDISLGILDFNDVTKTSIELKQGLTPIISQLSEKWNDKYTPKKKDELEAKEKKREERNKHRVTDQEKANRGKIEHAKFQTLSRLDGALDITTRVKMAWEMPRVDWCIRHIRDIHGIILATEYPVLSNMKFQGAGVSGFVDNIVLDEKECVRMIDEVVEAGTRIGSKHIVYPMKIIDFKTTSYNDPKFVELHIAQTLLYSYMLEERSENIRVSAVVVVYYNYETGQLTTYELSKRPTLEKFNKKLGLKFDTTMYDNVEALRKTWEDAFVPAENKEFDVDEQKTLDDHETENNTNQESDEDDGESEEIDIEFRSINEIDEEINQFVNLKLSKREPIDDDG